MASCASAWRPNSQVRTQSTPRKCRPATISVTGQKLTSNAEFNETQTTKRSAYRKKVAGSRKGKGSGDGGDASMAETDGDTTMGNADTTVNSVGSTPAGGDQHRTKKARMDGTGEGMDVDEEEQDASDPESVPNEDDDEEEAQDEEEEEGDEQEGGQEEVDQDELEERENRVDEDEALDDGNNSD